MEITLSKEQVKECAKAYWERRVNSNQRPIEARLEKWTKVGAGREHMTLCELKDVAQWKSPRVKGHVEKNECDMVVEISCLAFSENLDDTLRLAVLSLMSGASWPMASSILHFAFDNQYPILDVWAMKAVGGDQKYTGAKWKEYMRLCRITVKKYGVSLRELDCALWEQGKRMSERGAKRR